MQFPRSAAFRLALCACLAAPAAVVAQPAGTPSFGEPGLSPDHAEIAFISGGNIWSVASGGGTATILASVGGTAGRPLFSPDGKRLAFVSTRRGAAGIYVTELADGTTARLTHTDGAPELDGWSADGRWIYFSSSTHNIAYFRDIYRVSVSGGTAMPLVHEPYINAMEAAPSPDGSTLAYVRNGFDQWWRRGHSHMDESEVTLVHLADGRFDTLTSGDAKDGWPMWSPDGQAVYFVSDRSGSDQLWSTSGGRLRKLTDLSGDRVLFPTLSHDGRLIAFERGLRLWTYDTASGATHELSVELRGLPDVPATEHLALTSRFSALSLSPDGRKVAFVARGRVFAASAAAGGDATLVNGAPSTANDLPVWSHDSRTVAYVVDRGGEQTIATYAFPDGPERVLTPAGHHDDYPHWSPDGRSIAFVRDGTELHLFDAAARSDRVVARGFLDRRPFGDLGDIAFSPAGDWIAYVDNDRLGFSNVRVVRSSGGETRAVTFLPNTNGGPLAWSPDGTRIFYVTSQRTERADVAQVDLIPRAPRFREDEFRRLFRQEQPNSPELPSHTIPTPAPSAVPHAAGPERTPARHTEIDFNGIEQRTTLLQTGLDVTNVGVTPDGKTLVLVANDAAEQNLYSFSIDETADDPPVPRQLTNSPSSKRGLQISPDGRFAYTLDGGHISAVDIEGKGARPLAVSAALDVDFANDRPLVFEQAWSLLDRWYADPSFHGADWNAVRNRYLPFALGARSPSEFYRVLSLMIGEMNSSHSGIFAPPEPPAGPPLGRLAVDWDAATYDRDGRLRIASIVPRGPIALAGGIAVGDELLAVNGVTVGRDTDLDGLLEHAAGKRTELRIRTPAGERTVAVLPVDSNTEEQLRYLDWVAGRKAYVARISGGRVGYVHLYDMSAESLKRFYIDLDTENRSRQAVVVDIRNNEGGFVDPYAIDVLTRHEYLRFHSRFGIDASERTQLGQRVLDHPTALVINEHSLSDAETFTEAYRVLRAGPVVGEPTAGWIIFTSGTTLADGSTLRLPTTRVMTHDGVDLELHPRPVDVRASNPPGASEHGNDPQLDAAVRVLERRMR